MVPRVGRVVGITTYDGRGYDRYSNIGMEEV
jgi:hypothetical protein